MVIGYPPFYSENSKDTCKKIMNWKKFLKFPSNVKVSEEVKDLMSSLMNDVDKRLGYNGADEIKKHPWFRGVDWKNLKGMKAPFIPKVNSDQDTRYFETINDKTQPFYHAETKRRTVEKVSNIALIFIRIYASWISRLTKNQKTSKSPNFLIK